MKKVILLFLFFVSVFANQKISILLDWKYQFEFAGYIAAKEKGFYKDAGIDVDLVEYNNQNIVDDVLKGKYNFGIYDNNLIKYKINNKPIKLIASIFKRSALVLIVRDDITSLKQLENTTLMISKKDLQTFKDFLKERKVDISKIKFVTHTFTIEPFVEKKVDGFSAFITDEPYFLDKKGIKYNIFNPSDYGAFMYQGELFTNENFADKYPVLVNNFKNATIKGWKYALDHKKEIAKIIYDKYSKHKNIDALLDEANRLESIIQRRIYPIGYIDKNLLKSQFLYEANKLNKNIDLKIVDEYIFSFQNPLNLNENYLWIIKFHNFQQQHKLLFIAILIFLFILLPLIYYYFKIKQEKQKIETLFNKAPVAYILMDMEKRIILDANSYAYKLFKYPKDKPLYMNTKPFHINEECYIKFQEKVDKYLKNDLIETFSINWQFKKYTGEIFWTNIKAVIYEKNKILWILTDIDKLMKIQEKLNQQIKHTQKAMKVKEEFLANMSHEIRTPLNAILGFVDIIYNREKDKENKKYLEIIKKSGKNLLTVINDILDFSKIENGKLKIEKIEFNPKEEFEVIISLFEAKANEKNVTLKINMQNLEYNIISDPVRIKQVISNLISNAIKFTPSSKNVICNINYNKHTEKLYIEVIDEGIGIEEEKLNTIFKPFAQADTSTTRKFGGTGLGLSISKKLVDLLGGDLKVDSKTNKGSKFYFSIPAKKTKKIEEIEKIKKDNLDQNIKFNGKILIVEDNKANQMFLKILLNNLGIKDIDIANDGIEAIQKVENKKYDLIFMDENMPNMNGLEASKKIKEMGINTPIIAVTANALTGDKERFLEVMEWYIPKPIDKDKLIKVLSKYLKDKDD